ncbi:MAG: hypothetical protein A3H57_04540 [Candidatus Taylorbacteria bacterium RIFCSPLOWO2_02_FULL_43_11]|nr:MAG: hypothetical protein A3H57_04540 [Candidatus Taylorbacteria bacterium RIFCSPLOWO2_02_FULL_43_11]
MNSDVRLKQGSETPIAFTVPAETNGGTADKLYSEPDVYRTTSIKVYLIARISDDAREWNGKICSLLKPPIDLFLPQNHNPLNIHHEKIPLKVYLTDVGAIEEAHIGLVLPEFGSDCSFEVGYFARSEKPVIAFVDEQTEWLRNWMVKGGIDVVVTTNRQTYSTIVNDHILRHKRVLLAETAGELNEIIRRVFEDAYISKTFRK